jgi:hypothetical protein
VPDQFPVEIFVLMIDSGRASAEKLFAGIELLMNLQSRHEPDSLPIISGGLAKRDISDGIPGLEVVTDRIK